MNNYKVWIPVSERLPEVGIRVWGSEGKNDCGEDCYLGYKPAKLLESLENGFNDFGDVCWRYSYSSEPVRFPIKYWMELPNPPDYSATHLWDARKTRIDIEYVQQIIREKNAINAIPFEDIVWYQNNKEIELTVLCKDNWKFIGLSNIYFVDEKFWMSYEELEDVPN